MKVRAVLYIGLIILVVGCSAKDTRLGGERKMPDGSVFVDSKAQFLVKSPPALDLPRCALKHRVDPSRWQCSALLRSCSPIF